MNQYMRLGNEDDVRYVAQHMREADIEEVGALGFSPLDALMRSYKSSEVSYTLLEPNSSPIAIVGVSPSPLGASWGVIWLLGTDGIEHNAITFLRQSHAALEHLYDSTGKDVFYNYTYAKNTLHHKWLRWLGFKFLRRVELPPYNSEYIEFIKLRG